MSSLDIEATPLRLRELVRRGALPQDRLDAANDLILGPPDPRRGLQFVLMALGAALLSAGLGYFVAANWSALGRFARLGAVSGAVVAAVVVAVVVGVRSAGGRAALSVAGLAVGPALFLFGQTYQTGADAWELVAGWLLLLLPFALAARFAGVWWFGLLLLHTTLWLWLDQNFNLDNDANLVAFVPLFVIADVVALLVADVATRRSRRRGLGRGIAVIGALTASAVGGLGVVDDYGAWAVVDVVLAFALAGWLIAAFRRDLMRSALGLFVVGVVLSTLVGRALFDGLDLAIGGVFLEGCFVLGFVAAATSLLRTWHKSSGARAEDEP